MVSKARDRPEYSTRAMEFVRRAGVPFQVVEYDFDSQSGDLALHAAHAIGLEPRCVFKTLMVEVDQQPVCVLIPADRTVAMKSVARCLNGKRAKMMQPAKAERYSGYHTGGISPFAQRHAITVIIDESAMVSGKIALNGGQRGTLIIMSPGDIKNLLYAIIEKITPADG